MIQFILENIATILISFLLFLLVVVIIQKQFKGNMGCGNNCGGCPMAKQCHSKK